MKLLSLLNASTKSLKFKIKRNIFFLIFLNIFKFNKFRDFFLIIVEKLFQRQICTGQIFKSDEMKHDQLPRFVEYKFSVIIRS